MSCICFWVLVISLIVICPSSTKKWYIHQAPTKHAAMDPIQMRAVLRRVMRGLSFVIGEFFDTVRFVASWNIGDLESKICRQHF
jgi:hypothetical protein